MTREDILETIRTFINEDLDIDCEIDEETYIIDIGMDDLDLIDFIVFIEDEFGLAIDEDSDLPLYEMTISDVIDYILENIEN